MKTQDSEKSKSWRGKSWGEGELEDSPCLAAAKNHKGESAWSLGGLVPTQSYPHSPMSLPPPSLRDEGTRWDQLL